MGMPGRKEREKREKKPKGRNRRIMVIIFSGAKIIFPIAIG